MDLVAWRPGAIQQSLVNTLELRHPTTAGHIGGSPTDITWLQTDEPGWDTPLRGRGDGLSGFMVCHAHDVQILRQRASWRSRWRRLRLHPEMLLSLSSDVLVGTV
jgi:hypothetical protein